jgi:hypothetical protein
LDCHGSAVGNADDGKGEEQTEHDFHRTNLLYGFIKNPGQVFKYLGLLD